MIYITGDMHGDRGRFLFFPWDKLLNQNDTLIVCGDFGFLFFTDEQELRFLDTLEDYAFTICFLDGNHENFDAINAFPQETWHGGRVHRIRKNVLHLMRGQIFALEGKTFFTMGGAYSIDRYRRVRNESYWEEELPSNEEYRQAAKNLEQHGFHVDYILSHTAPRSMILRLCATPDPHDAELTGFLDWVLHETQFCHWYFGHWHMDRTITPQCTAVYQKTIRLTEQ